MESDPFPPPAVLLAREPPGSDAEKHDVESGVESGANKREVGLGEDRHEVWVWIWVLVVVLVGVGEKKHESVE
jgi:hypothetical protein